MKKIALIGCGVNAEFHVSAFKSVGIKIVAVAGNKNSLTAIKFAKKHNIKDVWSNPEKLAKQVSPYIDGFIISISINLVAPSPSRTIALARCSQSVVSASANSLASSESSLITLV